MAAVRRRIRAAAALRVSPASRPAARKEGELPMITLKKRLLLLPLMILALLLTVAPIPVQAGESYNLYLGSVLVDNYNEDDLVAAIRAAEPGSTVSGSARFDSSTNTLYLTDFRYEGPGHLFNYTISSTNFSARAAIYGDPWLQDLTIRVSGSNRLTLSSYQDADVALGGFFDRASVTVIGDSTEDELCLYGAEGADLGSGIGLDMFHGALTVSACRLCARGGDALESTGLVMMEGDLRLTGESEGHFVGGVGGNFESTGLISWDGSTGVYVEQNCALSCESGVASWDSCGLFAQYLDVQGGSVSAKSGNSDTRDSTALSCWTVTTSGASVTARAGVGDDSTGIKAYSVSLDHSRLEAYAGIADSCSNGVETSYFTLNDSPVDVAGGDGGYASQGIVTDYLVLAGCSSVNAAGGSAGSYSCGVYLYYDEPHIDFDSVLTCTGGETKDSSGRSYGMSIPTEALTLATGEAGTLIAAGYSQAIWSEYDSGGGFTLQAGYCCYSSQRDCAPGTVWLASGYSDHMALNVGPYAKYIRARGDARRGVALTGSSDPATGNVMCTVLADEEVRCAYLTAASYDSAGRLLDTRMWYYGTGDFVPDENGIPVPDMDPLPLGYTYNVFYGMDLAEGGRVSIFLLDALTFAPLCEAAAGGPG